MWLLLVFYPTTFIEERLLVVEAVIAWKGKSMGNQIRIGQRTIFEKCVLTSLAGKIPKNAGHSAIHPRFPFSRPFFFTLGLLGSSWSFSCVFGFHVLAVSFIFPWRGGRFCNARAWVVFLTFLQLLVHFPFTFLWFHVFFYHGCEEPFTFWLSHWLLGLTHWLFGMFSPVVSWFPW